MSELDAFEADVRKNIKLLSSDDAKVRERAARWLGEAGDPSAITRLRQVYKEDADRKVRDAAAYSLGMFRALERALDSDAADAVMDQLQDIAVNKAFGRRAHFRAKSLYRLSLGFIVSIAMLLVFNFVLWPRLEPQLGGLGVAALSNQDSGADEVRTLVNALKADVTTLQLQYQDVLGGGAVNCDVVFQNPSPLSTTGDLVTRANAALATFNEAKEAFVQACPPNTTVLTAASVGAPLGKVLQLVQTDLPALEAALGSGSSQPTPAPEATVEAPVSAPTEVPITPTPSYDVTPHTTALAGLISRMEGIGGANTLLVQYWADASANGTSGGCGQARPTIPEDYVLADAEAPEQLKLAASLINTGLALVRRGWDQFEQACGANNLSAAVQVGSSTATAATSAFANARTILDTFATAG